MYYLLCYDSVPFFGTLRQVDCESDSRTTTQTSKSRSKRVQAEGVFMTAASNKKSSFAVVKRFIDAFTEFYRVWRISIKTLPGPFQVRLVYPIYFQKTPDVVFYLVFLGEKK